MVKSVIRIVLIVLLSLNAAATDRPRLLVLTDIGGDPDDVQSLRRLLVYANEFRIEGLVATATEGAKGNRLKGRYFVFDNLIHDAINDYERVLTNLSMNAKGYPQADELRMVVKKGQIKRGVDNLIPGMITSGSQHIINVVDAGDEPLYITIWGGAHDLAQALLDVKTKRTSGDLDQFISKLRVYAIGDQDKKFTPKGTGEWIRKNFPDLFYIESGDIGRGMFQNDSPAGKEITPLVKAGYEFNDQKWIKDNVSVWGPLGYGYPGDVNQNPNTKRNSKGVKEGDTPSWFYVLPHGLNDPEDPELGGWGGRFLRNSEGYYSDAQDNHWTGKNDIALRKKWSVARWRNAYQNDFAARMRWCVLPFSKANHNPVAIINGDNSKDIITMNLRRGGKLKLNAGGSFDPDGDKLSYNWWIYHEVSSSTAVIKNGSSKTATIQTSETSSPGEVHIILEVTDDQGDPGKLYSFRRVIVNIMPD